MAFDTSLTAMDPMNEGCGSHTRGVVVVGVDGSTGAKQVLRWAIAEARLRQTRLRAVHAWTLDYGVGYGTGHRSNGSVSTTGGNGSVGAAANDLAGEDPGGMRRAAEEMLERATAEIASEADDVEIERRAAEGEAAEVLIAAATEDDLLVVGRGDGGLAGRLLGSVSQRCAHHARCPVVIVHARADEV